jgi:hypothetical protein|tara:strand:+ start:1830 stop:3269 length:1440 start_codon:yes stop_codon:yes gene_type:complete
MFKSFLFLFIFFISGSVFGQEEVFNFIQDDGTSLNRKKDGYSFSNKLNGDLAIVLIDRKTVFSNLFDTNFKKISTATGDAINKKYNDLLGYQIMGNTYALLATNSKKKKFIIQLLDFKNKTVNTKEIDLDFKKEKFLETVQYNNELYLLTATKSNTFILRTLSNGLNFEILKTFDIAFEERDEKLLKTGFLVTAVSNITKIDTRVPNAIEQAGKPNKLYQEGSKMYLTIEDSEDLVTIFHTIDLKSLTLKTKVFPYTKGRKGTYKRNNSFVLDGKLLQVGSSREEMTFTIKDFDNTTLKSYYIEKDKGIDIKNSPITQEGQTFIPFVNRREMEETSKYLRKITSGNVGVTGYRNGEEYDLSIGGYKNISSGGGTMMMPGGTNMAGPMGVGTGMVYFPTYNPTYISYNSYSSTKSTYFNTTLDLDFEYIKKEYEKNIFDRIKEFKRDIKFETGEDVFFHADVLYFGHYNTKTKTYHLYKM